MGRSFELQNEISVGEGAKKEKHNEGTKTIAETLEAIIGAMYLDGGFDVTKSVISGWYEPHLEKMLKE